MYDDFVVVGSRQDPAGVTGSDVLEALRRIARTGSAFISRGSRSGRLINTSF